MKAPISLQGWALTVALGVAMIPVATLAQGSPEPTARHESVFAAPHGKAHHAAERRHHHHHHHHHHHKHHSANKH